jgi:predicted negative regulator of RcsB-dependent stress response
MAELLGDVYLSVGKPELASKSYEQSLKGYVGRARSLRGLEKARQML